jgi:hypothetical protein
MQSGQLWNSGKTLQRPLYVSGFRNDGGRGNGAGFLARQQISDHHGIAGGLPAVAARDAGLDISVTADVLVARRFGIFWIKGSMMPFYAVRRLAGDFEELPCLLQLEDECAAIYFNIIHGARVRRRFTTQGPGEQCPDYVLVASETGPGGCVEEREIELFNST